MEFIYKNDSLIDKSNQQKFEYSNISGTIFHESHMDYLVSDFEFGINEKE